MPMAALADPVRPALPVGGSVAVMTATMSMSMAIRKAPFSKAQRRPMRSTRNSKKKKHATTLHNPKKPLIRTALFPAPTAAKNCGAKYAREVLP